MPGKKKTKTPYIWWGATNVYFLFDCIAAFSSGRLCSICLEWVAPEVKVWGTFREQLFDMDRGNGHKLRETHDKLRGTQDNSIGTWDNSRPIERTIEKIWDKLRGTWDNLTFKWLAPNYFFLQFYAHLKYFYWEPRYGIKNPALKTRLNLSKCADNSNDTIFFLNLLCPCIICHV